MEEQKRKRGIKGKKDRIFPQSALLILPKTINTQTKTPLRLVRASNTSSRFLVCKRTALFRAVNASHARDARFVALIFLVLHCCLAFLMLSVLGPSLPPCGFCTFSLAASSCSCSCGRTCFSSQSSLTVAH